MSAQQRLERLQKLLGHIREDVFHCIRFYELFARCADKRDILDAMSYSKPQAGFSASRDALHMSLMSALNRIYDLHADTASLKSILSIVKDQAVVDLILASKDEKQREEIRARLKYAIETCDKAVDSESARQIRGLRDRFLAHRDPRGRIDGLKHGQERELLEVAWPVISTFIEIFSEDHPHFDVMVMDWKQHSDNFWSNALNGPLASKPEEK